MFLRSDFLFYYDADHKCLLSNNQELPPRKAHHGMKRPHFPRQAQEASVNVLDYVRHRDIYEVTVTDIGTVPLYNCKAVVGNYEAIIRQARDT